MSRFSQCLILRNLKWANWSLGAYHSIYHTAGTDLQVLLTSQKEVICKHTICHGILQSFWGRWWRMKNHKWDGTYRKSIFLFHVTYSSMPPCFSGLTAFSCMVSPFFGWHYHFLFPLDQFLFTHKFSPLFGSSALPSLVFTSSYYPLTEILTSIWGPLSLNCSQLLFPKLLLPYCSCNFFPVPMVCYSHAFLVLLSMKDQIQ